MCRIGRGCDYPHRCPGGGSTCQQFGDQPALADARRAADQRDQPAIRRDRALKPHLELGELSGPSHERAATSKPLAAFILERALADDLGHGARRAIEHRDLTDHTGLVEPGGQSQHRPGKSRSLG